VDAVTDAAEAWWVEPVTRFIDYVEQERDLADLNRGSIEAVKSRESSEALEAVAASLSHPVPA